MVQDFSAHQPKALTQNIIPEIDLDNVKQQPTISIFFYTFIVGILMYHNVMKTNSMNACVGFERRKLIPLSNKWWEIFVFVILNLIRELRHQLRGRSSSPTIVNIGLHIGTCVHDPGAVVGIIRKK